MRHHEPERGGWERPALGTVLLWASLVPVLALARPYGGLIKDARIYIGRGLADRDPAGLGRDLLFANDPQTGFSALAQVVRGLLTVMPAGQASLLLVSVGLLLWLCAAVAVARVLTSVTSSRTANDRLVWATVVAILALPSAYGAFDLFGYAEANATPRIFAEAAVLASFAAALAGRRSASLAFLVLAGAIHPLMALPGLAVGACLLVLDDRRWLALLAGLGAAVLAAAFSRVPLLDRMFIAMDPTWTDIMRSSRSYLFPTAWPSDTYGRIAVQAAAAIIAGRFAPARARALLWSVVVVAVGGLLASLIFGDLIISVLIAQLQLWRALWPLAVLGNAGLVLAVVGLWRAGAAERIASAVLIMAWTAAATPALAILLAVTALGLPALVHRSGITVPRQAPRIAFFAALILVLINFGVIGVALVSLFSSLHGWGGEAPWSYVVASGAFGYGAVAAALVAAIAPPRLFAGRGPVLAGCGILALLCGAAAVTYDGRTSQLRMIERRDGSAGLADALGPGGGSIVWIDEESESWFLARRAAFFSEIQGGPILFSRDLALSWIARRRYLVGLGLVREADFGPWSSPPGAGADEIKLTPDSLLRLCSAPDRPAALVAPGEQLAAVPPGLTASLWSPPSPFRRLVTDGDDLRWRTFDVFTVVRCTPAVP